MKQTLILLLLTLAVSLGAMVNIGDEYIGSTPMGQFRKLSQSTSNTYHDGPDCNSTSYYYYNEFIPTRLDSIQIYFSGDLGDDLSVRYFEYSDFDGYYQATDTCYRVNETNGNILLSESVYKYDLQDRILEYHQTVGYNASEVNRIVYDYDASGNLLLKKEYKTAVNGTIPYRVTTNEYDEQNRVISIQVVVNQNLQQSVWHTWGQHSLPDSTHIIYNDPISMFRLVSQKNHFDETGEMYYSTTLKRYRNTDSWERTDQHLLYTMAHGMAFPITIYEATEYPYDPDAPFEPQTTTVHNYQYSNDYHSIISCSSPCECYEYDENWLMTSLHRTHDVGSHSKSITWEYYGPTPSDDPTAVPAAQITAYPNPAKGMVNINLSKSSINTPVDAKIYNIKGQLVRNLQANDLSNGHYLYHWDCKDQNNHAVPSGVYLVRIKTGGGEISKKVTVTK